MRKSESAFTIIFLIIPVTWAGSFIAGKYVVSDLDAISSVILRFIFSALLMLPGLLLFNRNKHPDFRNGKFLFHLIIVVLTSGIGYHLFFFWALEHASPSNTAIIIALNPFFTAFGEILIFKKPRPKRFYGGFILAFSGAMWINLSRDGTIGLSSLGMGELYALIASLLWAIYTISAKITKQDEWDSFWINSYNYLFTGALLIPFAPNILSVSLYQNIGMPAWYGLIYMAIFPTAFGYTLFYIGVQRRGPAWAATFIYLVPSFTVILDRFFFDARITAAMVFGTILVVSGLFLSNIGFILKRRQKGSNI